MTLRTKSKLWQCVAWLGTGLVALAAYVVLSRLLYGMVVWSVLDLRAQRPVLSQPSTSNSSLTGEALFAQARALRHRKIPDFNKDAEYLDLLGQSAQEGYAPALAKLGEYAMRRAAWVEAYYWMSMAKRQGMPNLVNAMRKIRMHWARDGFPRQSSDVNELFTAEAGSIGRALLRVDSGHEAAKAKEFLKAKHPEFLP